MSEEHISHYNNYLKLDKDDYGCNSDDTEELLNESDNESDSFMHPGLLSRLSSNEIGSPGMFK
jgi:hypothetical protein